jgi:hypothetical protein
MASITDKVIFKTIANPDSPIHEHGLLYSQEVNGRAKLFFKDEQGIATNLMDKIEIVAKVNSYTANYSRLNEFCQFTFDKWTPFFFRPKHTMIQTCSLVEPKVFAINSNKITVDGDVRKFIPISSLVKTDDTLMVRKIDIDSAGNRSIITVDHEAGWNEVLRTPCLYVSTSMMASFRATFNTCTPVGLSLCEWRDGKKNVIVSTAGISPTIDTSLAVKSNSLLFFEYFIPRDSSEFVSPAFDEFAIATFTVRQIR